MNEFQTARQEIEMSHNGTHRSSPSRWGKGAALAIVAAVALGTLPQAGFAEAAKTVPAGLAGSWSGGGSVTFALGGTEQARCRAHYKPAGNDTYTVNATCATPSGRAAQSATVRRVSENKYSGSFYNADYGISGTVHIVVRGASQTIRLVSDSASAVITLSR